QAWATARRLAESARPIAVLGQGGEGQILASADRDKGDGRGDQQTERYQASRRYPVLRRGLVGHRSMLACRGRPGSNLRVSVAKTRVPNFPDSRENAASDC